MKHDIINQEQWLHSQSTQKRKETGGKCVFAVGIVLLFAAICSPVFFQCIFGLFLKG